MRVARGTMPRVGQCPVIVSTLMSGELKCPTGVRACVSTVLVALCRAAQQVHSSGESEEKGLRREVQLNTCDEKE